MMDFSCLITIAHRFFQLDINRERHEDFQLIIFKAMIYRTARMNNTHVESSFSMAMFIMIEYR